MKDSVRGGLLILPAIFFALLIAPAGGQTNPPSITGHPTGRSVSPGANVTFNVSASGTQPLSFQWFQNGTEVDGGTNSSLALSNVVLSQAGNYLAIVTNDWGSATSVVAVLNIDPTFTKITTGSVVADGGDSSGAAWGDYDNDGDLDLFVGNNATANALYQNNGDGTFTRVTNSATLNRGYGCAWGDFDNDGNLDIIVSNQGTNYIYRNNGGGVFTPVPGTAGAVSWSISWADYNRDGWLDFYLANGAGNNDLLLSNNWNNTFTRITNAPIGTAAGTTIAGAWADYNEDGFPDLFTSNNGGLSPLYRNQGNGTFTNVTGSPFNLSGNVILADWGDYDNDGHLDLALACIGPNRIYHNNGNGTFTQITTGAIVTDSFSSEISQWVDYDNDGFLDLFVANSSGQNENLYHNNGNGTFTKITTGSIVNDGGNSAGCAWGDYDNDGFMDLFVANWQGSRPNFLYRNNGNSNAWLKVRCIGTASNRDAVGAKVRVQSYFGGAWRWQVREISGGIGFGQTPGANFGLGNATNVETVRIEWPSGAIQEFHGISTNQLLTIIEPPQVSRPRFNADSFEFDFIGLIQSNYVVETSIDLNAWTNLSSILVTNRNMTFSEMMDLEQKFYRVRGP